VAPQRSEVTNHNHSHFSTALCDAAFSHKSHVINTTAGSTAGTRRCHVSASRCLAPQLQARSERCVMYRQAFGQLFPKFITPLPVIIPQTFYTQPSLTLYSLSY
jgi:hypothetical protein